MTVQTFSIEFLRKVRQHIVSGLQLPDSFPYSPQVNELDTFDIPEPDSLDALGGVFNMGGLASLELEPGSQVAKGAWSISMVNPADVLLKLPGLTLQPHVRLAAFVFRAETNGRGIIWAIPEEFCTTSHLNDVLVTGGGIDHPPQPPEAYADFMAAIEGDRSPTSFLIASILRREFLEFGAQGTYQNWTHHRLIDAVPEPIKPYWKAENPQNLKPKISVLGDGRVAVEFFTCRVKAPIAVLRHVDQYPSDQYTAKSAQRVLIKLNAPRS